jgi:hypothetical protein
MESAKSKIMEIKAHIIKNDFIWEQINPQYYDDIVKLLNNNLLQ